ncbi:MAG: leucyl aminopeptidase [Rhizobiales bacterium]|nr:leucyl aminopeptidase [Hyphomicrobiales bacterium]NRB12992.1 leucyl aminopeptidase [Hyphomicrobiales bacterium]
MKYGFNDLSDLPKAGTSVYFAYQDDADKAVLDGPAELADKATDGQISRAINIAKFKAEPATTLEIIAPNGLAVDAIIIVGLGKLPDVCEESLMDTGANAFGVAQKISDIVNYIYEHKKIAIENILMGAELRGYKWDKYQTVKKDETGRASTINVYSANKTQDAKTWDSKQHVAAGVLYARDLINEPSNKLNPETYAERLKEFSKIGIKVEVLGEKQLTKLGFGSLLSVGQGSAYESHVVVMQYNGGAKNDAPIALVGKGVTFDTGGISLKPSPDMDAMKGDMGGSAAVVGAIRALAARKAKVNVVCVVGLVENMPSHMAMKPGDVVTSLSGQTIENLNTDAEGRLVLADILWYTQDRFNPKVMLNAATLTGAIVVALGTHYGGFFTNDESLVAPMKIAGDQVGEPIWQMPLHKFYDKKIDTPNADVKNMADRWGGAIYAAAFLQRFVNDTPWVHVDLAGTIFGAGKTPTNQGWSSGYGVRLFERFISKYES